MRMRAGNAGGQVPRSRCSRKVLRTSAKWRSWPSLSGWGSKHTKLGRFAQPGERLLPLREERRQHGLQYDASRWDEVEHRFVPRLLVLAYEHMAAAAADRQPVEITSPFRLSLPPLGRLAHADAAESIAYLAVAGVLQHASRTEGCSASG